MNLLDVLVQAAQGKLTPYVSVWCTNVEYISVTLLFQKKNSSGVSGVIISKRNLVA